MNLVCFDFDGTITKDDSLLGFIAYVVGFKKFFKGVFLLSPILILYQLGLISNNFTRQKLMMHFFGGISQKEFDKICYKYSKTHIDGILLDSAMAKIYEYKANGDTVCIVSASLTDWLKPWCDEKGLDLIATNIKKTNGIITGEIDGKNCYGDQKVKRIKEKYNLKKFNKIIAYGDSRGDKEMLEFADESYYRKFS